MKRLLLAASMAVVMSACQSGQKPSGETAGDNPFFSEYTTPFGVPPFDKIKVEHYKPAFTKALEEHDQEIKAIVENSDAPTFENTILAFDNSGELLTKVMLAFSSESSINATDELQALEQEIYPILSKHSDDIRLNADLFAKIKTVYDRRDSLGLDKEQAKLLEKTYKSFARQGANLPKEAQEKLRVLNENISTLELTFNQNLLKETNAFHMVVDKKEDLAGLSESLIAAAAAQAEADSLPGKWVFTLHNPSIMPFLQYADNRELREKLFTAYLMRGNNNNKNDNKEIVKRLVTARLEKAKLLGYDDFANYQLAENMAKNEDNAYKLMNEVWKPALQKAKEELADIQAEVQKEGGNFEVASWDWRYYAEKAKQAKFELNENEIRPYLELSHVRDGAFFVANKLYGVTFTQLDNIPLPDPDAQAFECKDKDGSHLGILYMDFFTRPGKAGGAWCGSYRSESYDAQGNRIAPIVTTVYNFSKPVDGQPALLNADEAGTIFHEFGHALNALFANVHYKGVGDVPIDFVELPSQVMEHWVFEPEVLKAYAKHYQTGEVMPQALVDKIVKSGKYGQGFATTEFLAAALLDMRYHSLKEIPANFSTETFEKQVLNDEYGLISQIPPRYRSTYFSHTMGGGYSAGYYSYVWAEVLDADAFEAFKETGDIFNQEVAAKFRNCILSAGGVEDAMEMYKNFRGKEPNTDPLLKNRGLK